MVDINQRLSQNFIFKELLYSATAERDPNLKALQYHPPLEVVDNLTYLVERVLQPIRRRFGVPIHITSGYRCPILNKLVGGSATSQHCLGEAADCHLSPSFSADPQFAEIRAEIEQAVIESTGERLRPDTNANFYLFSWICLNLEQFDIDQVIHEYGEDFGQPAWIHIAASERHDRRQILAVGEYTDRKYIAQNSTEALALGTRAYS